MNVLLSKDSGLRKEKGMALYIVLSTFLVVVILAHVLLAIVGNQNRLTHHQSSRIQAYYASQAALVFAIEQLRLHQDEVAGTTVWSQCGRTINCGPIPYVDAAFPFQVVNRQVDIFVVMPGWTFMGMGPCLGTESACVYTRSRYAYTTP